MTLQPLSPILKINSIDSVAIALVDLPAGRSVSLAGGDSIEVIENIPSGHKIALDTIPAGSVVLRYGFPIGSATREISKGAWVHTHNLGIENIERSFDPAANPHLFDSKQITEAHTHTFMGYARSDRRAGTRNYVAIISAVNCVNPIVRAIQRRFSVSSLTQYPNIDGVLAITHDSGCSLETGGMDHLNLRQILTNLAHHPNIAAALVIGLGCEVNLMADIVTDENTAYLGVQDEGGTSAVIEKAVPIIQHMLKKANQTARTPQPLSKLVAALQCGGSDAFSGITGNPLMGQVSDRIVSEGGTVVMAETTEIFGAEQLLLQRAANPAAAEKLVAILQWWQEYARRTGGSVDNNPSPGNKAGGLTNIFEKSLGAVSKCGTYPLQAVYEYAEPVTAKGVCFMDSPGNDAASLTGQVAGGCNLVLFTTGRGTTYAPGIAPCLKIATTSRLYQHMQGDMDINAGEVLEGISLEECGANVLEKVIAAASGARTKSEELLSEQVDLVPWRRGGLF